MTWNLGYLMSTAIFLAALLVLAALQIAAKRFRPFLYWATIIASTTAGTTLADFADRSLGIGYPGGSLLLLACLLTALGVWYRAEGSISVNTVNTPRVEAFYWVTITFFRHSARRSETGWRMRGWDILVARSYSARRSPSSLRPTFGPRSHTSRCSGLRSS